MGRPIVPDLEASQSNPPISQLKKSLARDKHYYPQESYVATSALFIQCRHVTCFPPESKSSVIILSGKYNRPGPLGEIGLIRPCKKIHAAHSTTLSC